MQEEERVKRRGGEAERGGGGVDVVGKGRGGRDEPEAWCWWVIEWLPKSVSATNALLFFPFARFLLELLFRILNPLRASQSYLKFN